MQFQTITWSLHRKAKIKTQFRCISGDYQQSKFLGFLTFTSCTLQLATRETDGEGGGGWATAGWQLWVCERDWAKEGGRWVRTMTSQRLRERLRNRGIDFSTALSRWERREIDDGEGMADRMSAERRGRERGRGRHRVNVWETEKADCVSVGLV